MQRIHLNKTEIIKSKFQCRFKIHNTQLNRRLFTQYLQKFVTDIFNVDVGLSPGFMNDIFEYVEKPYSLRINPQFKSKDPNNEIWNWNRKIWHRIFFQVNVKLSSSLWLDYLMQATIWRQQLYSDGRFEPLINSGGSLSGAFKLKALKSSS